MEFFHQQCFPAENARDTEIGHDCIVFAVFAFFYEHIRGLRINELFNLDAYFLTGFFLCFRVYLDITVNDAHMMDNTQGLPNAL
jgi:hypothetical protein